MHTYCRTVASLSVIALSRASTGIIGGLSTDNLSLDLAERSHERNFLRHLWVNLVYHNVVMSFLMPRPLPLIAHLLQT